MDYFDFYIDGDAVDWMSSVYEGVNSQSTRKDRRIYDDVINLLENPLSRISTPKTINEFLTKVEEIGIENAVENPIVRFLLEKHSSSNFRLGISSEYFKENNSGTTFNFAYNLEMPPNFSSRIDTKEWKEYFNKYSIKVSKDTNDEDLVFSSWDAVKEMSHPSKDFLIIDNYICSSDDISNLFKIITVLLKDQDSTNKNILNLMIITSKLYSEPYSEKEVKLSELYQRIKKHLDSNFKFHNVNLSIIKIRTSENHDRYIFTDYFTFKSGNSFNYLDSITGEIRLTSNTEFEIIPHTSINNNKTYGEYYNRNFLPMIKKLVKNVNSNHSFGNKKNRLLGIV